MKITNMKLGQILLNSGVLSESQLDDALAKQRDSHKRLGQILIEDNFITEMQMIRSLEEQLDVPYLDLRGLSMNPTLSELLPENVMRTNVVVPIKREGSVLTIAVADPLDYNVINDIGTYTKLKITLVISERQSIETKIKELFSTQKAFAAAKEMSDQNAEAREAAAAVTGDEQSQPIIRFVNNMIEQAVMQKASDIHIEPLKKIMRIRFRVDGRLGNYMEAGADLLPSIVSRIKFIGGMNIAERRIPQDGRINYMIGEQEIDLRISVLPSLFGEKIVIRITTALDVELTKESIGFLPENLEKYNRLLKSNHGIILLTGPTGSGKTTTLYTSLKEIMTDDLNMMTVENPVEMVVPGVTQVEINEKAGLTFSKVLRSVLRQDPDILMIGEIRDRETAEIASSCAITGHLVFSTLHTYDAPSAIVRLVDMGIEPFMVVSSVIGIISQRLIRTLCPHCKEQYEATVADLEMLSLPIDEKVLLYKAKGCHLCNSKGYRGRTAIHEIMTMTNAVKDSIHSGISLDKIGDIAISEGMITLEENMKRLVINGVTSTNEIASVYATKM